MKTKKELLPGGTKIEWTDYTVNFWWGCTEVSPACAHCYARTLSKLYSHGRASWGRDGLRWIRTEAVLAELKRYNHRAAKAGVIRRVFINSMSDTFEDRADLAEARAALFEMVEKCPRLIFQLLTKRPENVPGMAPAEWRGGWPANVWMGTTVEDQARAEERIPALLAIPARVRFLSCEPMVGPVDMRLLEACPRCTPPGDPGCPYCLGRYGINRGIHWVICGGESGAKARPMHPDWARGLRDQCDAVGVPYFFKQWGEWAPHKARAGGDLGGDMRRGKVRHVYADREPDGHFRRGDVHMERVGKHAAGRQLDGVEHSAFPEVAA